MNRPILTVVLTLSFGPPSAAADLQATWDAVTLDVDGNPETISHYVLYYGKTARPGSVRHPSNAEFGYDTSVNAGNNTRHLVTGLDEGAVYFFAVAAVDYSGNVSDYSAEVNSQGEESQPPVEGGCGCASSWSSLSFPAGLLVVAWFLPRKTRRRFYLREKP